MSRKKLHKISETEYKIKKLKQQKLENLYIRLINISFNDKEKRKIIINNIYKLEEELNVTKIDYKLGKKVYKTNHYERKKITQNKYKKLEKLYSFIQYHNDGYYKKYNISNKMKKYIKHIANKKVRHSNNFKLNGNGYKKVYDYKFYEF